MFRVPTSAFDVGQPDDLPERGRIGISNRSYYEEVLIVRVHREILEAQGDSLANQCAN